MNVYPMGDVGPNGVVPDSFGAFLIEGASLTSKEQYPILREDMVPDSPPLKIMPFNKALNYRGDLSDTYICTFSPDSSFERIRQHPKRYVDFFKRTAGIIGFDYSIHIDMPLVKQKEQINDNLSLTYYYGNQGIDVIPNIRCGIEELLPEFLEAIPKNRMIAIGTHGFCKEVSEMCEWRCFLERTLPEINPPAIITYGSLRGRMFDDLKDEYNFVFYEPWITARRKGVKDHVD